MLTIQDYNHLSLVEYFPIANICAHATRVFMVQLSLQRGEHKSPPHSPVYMSFAQVPVNHVGQFGSTSINVKTSGQTVKDSATLRHHLAEKYLQIYLFMPAKRFSFPNTFIYMYKS